MSSISLFTLPIEPLNRLVGDRGEEVDLTGFGLGLGLGLLGLEEGRDLRSLSFDGIAKSSRVPLGVRLSMLALFEFLFKIFAAELADFALLGAEDFIIF
jgi:hypothetical protein